MHDGRRLVGAHGIGVLVLALFPGCATMRNNAPSPDLRPCSDGFAYTRDGWKLGVRHIRPANPDPDKLPVVLCHGLGLNGTFWTITDNHLPSQLAARGYDVFIFDLRGSGNSVRVGLERINERRRQGPFPERGEKRWNVDETSFYDVPAVLDYVKTATGHGRVNWVGHSLGGMLLFPFLELSPEADRIANFVGMGSTIVLAEAPQRDMLRANRGLRMLATVVSPGRLGRPLTYARFPGLEHIDAFYFTASNVDKQTVSRFYGYTLEDTGRAALKQLDPYLAKGHFVSADGRTDYVKLLDRVKVPILLVAGDADIMSDVPSTQIMFDAIASPDKMLFCFGKKEGQYADYGHCDLVWSRYAPREIFPPVIDWLDMHQKGLATEQGASEQGPGRSEFFQR
jgi:lysosomal acid lipase/cholesteryl ester hydrolase